MFEIFLYVIGCLCGFYFGYLFGYDRGYMRCCEDLGKERHGEKSDERKA